MGRIDWIDEGDVVSQYRDQKVPIVRIARTLGVSDAVIRRVLVAHGVAIRSRAESLVRIDCDQLRRLYVDEALSPAEIQTRMGISSSGMHAALERCGIPPRPGGTELTIPRGQLAELLAAGVSDAEIAQRFGVTPWAVRRRCRAEQLRRPITPPNARPRPPEAELRTRYVDQRRSLTDLATSYQVPPATVRRWVDQAGIERRTGSRETRPAPPSLEITAELLMDLYVTKGWTAEQIGEHVGRTKKIVLAELHSCRIPIRPSGARRPGSTVLLDALYADHRIVELLDAHDIPVVARGGPLSERFPVPGPPIPALVDELYHRIGLPASSIGLLIGHPEDKVRNTMAEAGIETRPAGTRSPWRATSA